MINPVFLRTFMCLVETRHFTRTAEQLHMTQPGVSQHIQKLEAQFTKPLLNRHGKTFELTPAGESLYQYGLQQVEAEAELFQSITGDDAHVGECRLACSGSMAMLLYPQLLQLQEQFPDLFFSVEASPNGAIIERIKSNQSELGLVTQPVTDPSIRQQVLGEDELCLVVPAGADASWQNLINLGFINHPDGHHYGAQLLEVNFPNQFGGMTQIPQAGYINQLSQILLPVSKGLGFTVLPRSAVDAFSEQHRLSISKQKVVVNELVYLITKKHRILPSRYQLIETMLSKQWR